MEISKTASSLMFRENTNILDEKSDSDKESLISNDLARVEVFDGSIKNIFKRNIATKFKPLSSCQEIKRLNTYTYFETTNKIQYMLLDKCSVKMLSVDLHLTLKEVSKYLFNTNDYFNYRYRLSEIQKKELQILNSEILAIKDIKNKLNLEIPIQRRLHNLEDVDFLIFLSSVYVEKSHIKDPLIAYNYSDSTEPVSNCTKCKKQENENLNMLSCYSNLLEFLSSDDVYNEDKLADKIIEIAFGIPRTCKQCSIKRYYDRGPSEWKTDKLSLISFQEGDIRLNYLKITIKTCKADKEVRFITNSYSHNEIFIAIKNMSSYLIKALKNKNVTTLIRVTSELMYAHFFTDGNNRLGQVIRDCFLITINQLPLSALSYISHYIYINAKPDTEHICFLQQLTLDILEGVEDKTLSIERTKLNGLEYLESLLKFSDNKSISCDVSFFISLTHYANSNFISILRLIMNEININIHDAEVIFSCFIKKIPNDDYWVRRAFFENLDYSFDINQRTNESRSIIAIDLIDIGFVTLLNKLIRYDKLNFSLQDSNGNTLLHYILINHKKLDDYFIKHKIIKEIIKKSKDCYSIKNKLGETALDLINEFQTM